MSNTHKLSKENILGRNIQHLRKMNGETLKELGEALFFEGSTIANYEAGDREPKPQIISAIAKHYGKTVDELVNSDLTELPKHDFSIHGMSTIVELWKIVFPLSSSERAMQNDKFKRGYNKCCNIIDSFSRNDPVIGHVIPECFELFYYSMVENDLSEAAANIIWLLFLNWSQILDESMINALASIIYPRKNTPSANKVILKVRSNESEEVIKRREEFINDFDDIAMELIKFLKSNHEWSDMADYYLGMKYLLGMVDTGLSTEMNVAVGMQMLLSQVQLGNKYSLNTLEALISL